MLAIARKLREAQALASTLIAKFQQIKELSADDEFEVEYLVDGIIKDGETLRKIGDSYPNQHIAPKEDESKDSVRSDGSEKSMVPEKLCSSKLHVDLTISGTSADSAEKDDFDFGESDDFESSKELLRATVNTKEVCVPHLDNETLDESVSDAASDVTEDYDQGKRLGEVEELDTDLETNEQVPIYVNIYRVLFY